MAAGYLDGGFVTAWERADAELRRRMEAAFSVPGPWRERMRGALGAGLVFLAEDPARARLYIAEALFAEEERVRRRRAESLDCLAAMIGAGRERGPGAPPVPAIVAAGIAGGIWHRVHRLVREGGGAVELPVELPQLMYFVVMPYRGRAAAQEELRRPVLRAL